MAAFLEEINNITYQFRFSVYLFDIADTVAVYFQMENLRQIYILQYFDMF